MNRVVIPHDTVGAFVRPPSLLVPGARSGPLAGRTLAVKDVFDVAGLVTGAGNPDFASTRSAAPVTAASVQRLVDAGASVVGTTVTDELAYSLAGTNVHFGTPRNVNAPGRAPGGSSAGSAAAVAAGLVDLAIGTDTGGSVRVPASYCGVLGWRPTHGAVTVEGVVPLAPSFDTVGLFARDLGLLTTGAAALLGGPPPTTSAIERVVIVGEVVGDLPPAIVDRLGAIARTFGAEPEIVESGLDLDAALDAFRTLQGAEAWATHGEWITATGPSFGPGIAARFRAASKVTPAQVAEATVVRAEVSRVLAEITGDGAVIVMPAAAGAAPRLDAAPADIDERRSATLRLTCLAGHAGLPVVVAPLLESEGLPLGAAFIGAGGSDRSLLDWLAPIV